MTLLHCAYLIIAPLILRHADPSDVSIHKTGHTRMRITLEGTRRTATQEFDWRLLDVQSAIQIANLLIADFREEKA